MKKFELTKESVEMFGRKFFRIKALINFGNVKIGDLGGYVEKEDNLSHSGNAWVLDNAQVFGDARVCGNAYVCGNAHVSCDADYICFKGFGSKNRNTTMFRAKENNICVVCGCFHGTLQEFEDKVKETHGDSKYAKEYLACVETAKIHFEV